MARKTGYRKEFDEQAERLCRLGATDKDLAEFFHISEATLANWKNKHPSFMESLKVAKDYLDSGVQVSLYRRAMGYEHPEVHISNYQGVITQTPIVKRYPPDTTACIFWLKNRKPAEWRERVEHTGANGGPIKTENVSDLELARRAAFMLSTAAEKESEERVH